MPVGLVVIVIGFFGLTQVTENTSYTLLIAELFVLGLGMGATMMPLFTAALKTLRAHEVARGSTLLNINQQIGSSVGVAVISVILTATSTPPTWPSPRWRPPSTRRSPTRSAARRPWRPDSRKRRRPSPTRSGWPGSWWC